MGAAGIGALQGWPCTCLAGPGAVGQDVVGIAGGDQCGVEDGHGDGGHHPSKSLQHTGTLPQVLS